MKSIIYQFRKGMSLGGYLDISVELIKLHNRSPFSCDSNELVVLYRRRAQSMLKERLTQKALNPLMCQFGFNSLLRPNKVDQLAYSVNLKFWAKDPEFYTLDSRLEWALIRGEIEY
jgi:hypothetical protein